jgi:hypothetical protein
MEIKIIIWILASIISAILYRAGGMGQEDTAEPKWIPKWLRHSWCRDWLIPGVCLLTLWSNRCIQVNWSYLLFYGLTGVALSTYWDWLFGYDNFWFAGFLVGLATLSLAFAGVFWWFILVRAIILALLWGSWSAWMKKDYWEEEGRGAFIIVTLLLI